MRFKKRLDKTRDGEVAIANPGWRAFAYSQGSETNVKRQYRLSTIVAAPSLDIRLGPKVYSS